MDISFLSKTRLFAGVEPDVLTKLLEQVHAYSRRFAKGEAVLYAGDPVTHMGLVLQGSVLIAHEDLWGNRSILGRAASGEVFAETYACVTQEPLPMHVTAAEPTQVLFVHGAELLHAGTSGLSAPVTANLVRMLAQKNLNLSGKIRHITPKTIRGRLLSYLSAQSIRQSSYVFDIPFNRQQLADYLNVDRSAMCHELTRMQREGLVDFHKNSFRLIQR